MYTHISISAAILELVLVLPAIAVFVVLLEMSQAASSNAAVLVRPQCRCAIDAWRERVLPDEDELEEFWDSMEGNPQLNDHPVLLRESWKKKAIPLCIHGDGVPLTGIGKSWSKFMDVFYCIINLGLWLDSTRNVFALVFFASLYSSFGGMHTSDYLFKRLKLSLLQAWHGKHPTHMMMTTFSTSPTPRRA